MFHLKLARYRYRYERSNLSVWIPSVWQGVRSFIHTSERRTEGRCEGPLHGPKAHSESTYCILIPCIIVKKQNSSHCRIKNWSPREPLNSQPNTLRTPEKSCFDSTLRPTSCFKELAICIEPIHEAPLALRRDCICTVRKWRKTPGSSDPTR